MFCLFFISFLICFQALCGGWSSLQFISLQLMPPQHFEVELKLLSFSMAAADRSLSLRSAQWSCSDLAKGAAMCADMAGLSFTGDVSKMTREELLESIKDMIC